VYEELLSLVSTTQVHGPSSQAELTARQLGVHFLTPVNLGVKNFLSFTGRVHGRPVCTIRGDGPI